MSSELSPINLLYQICSYTSCFPLYDFKTLRLKSSNNHIFYLLFIICVILAQFVFSTYGRDEILQMEFSLVIADNFANIALCGCNIITCFMCFYIGNKYMNKLSLLFANVDFRLNHSENVQGRIQSRERRENSGFNNNKENMCLLILTHCIFGILIVLDVYVTLYYFYENAIYYYIVKYFQYYFVTSQILFIVLSTKKIKKLVWYVMSTLLDNMNRFLTLPAAEMREGNNGLFTLTGWTKTALNTKADFKDVANVKLATQQYKEIYLLCYYFNVIYGWTMLFVMGVVLFELIQTMNFTVQYTEKLAVNNIWMLCLRILIGVYFYALQTWMILSCDYVTEEVTRFANFIYKQILIMSEVQETLADHLIMKELVTLWYHITNNKPKFKAGFVILRKKFIYGSFIGVSSFIAVIVEFNRVVYGHHHTNVSH